MMLLTAPHQSEDAMTRILTAIAVTAFSIATFATSAQAGFKGRFAVGFAIGALGAMAHEAHRYEEHRHWRARKHVRRHSEKVYVKRAVRKTPEVAEAKSEPQPQQEPATPPLPVSKAEALRETDGAITTAAIKTDSDETPVSATGTDCRKFFPSVGLTLSVPCE
jgi:hypothetical protein